jgi:hypothetical protein
MPTRQQALDLIRQLERAESVVSDLFLEATDDGIEALEAVLQACRDSVLSRPQAVEGDGPGRSGRARRGRGRRRGGQQSRQEGDPPATAPGDGES